MQTKRIDRTSEVRGTALSAARGLSSSWPAQSRLSSTRQSWRGCWYGLWLRGLGLCRLGLWGGGLGALVLGGMLGCSETSAPETTPEEEEQAPLGAWFDEQCGAGTEVELEATEDSANPMKRATLSWDKKSKKCAFERGNSIPRGMVGVAQFGEVNGSVDVYSVVPWSLSVPKSVDPAEPLKAEVEYTVYATWMEPLRRGPASQLGEGKNGLREGSHEDALRALEARDEDEADQGSDSVREREAEKERERPEHTDRLTLRFEHEDGWIKLSKISLKHVAIDEL